MTKSQSVAPLSIYRYYNVFHELPEICLCGDAWGDYQALKAANRAQNQANMQQFKNGSMSAQDLEREWDRIAREEHEAAKKVEKEWKEKGEKRGKEAREKYEKDKKKQEEEAAKRKKEAEEKMKKGKEEMDRKARETRKV